MGSQFTRHPEPSLAPGAAYLLAPGRGRQAEFFATARAVDPQWSGLGFYIGRLWGRGRPPSEVLLKGPGEGSHRGEALFNQYGCVTCHLPDGKGRGPSLVGVYNSQVKLQNGQVVKADDAYLRESVLNPRAKTVEGYQSIMPTFQGQISEEGLLQIIAYIKSLEKEEGGEQ